MTEPIEYSIFPVTKPFIELRGCDVSLHQQTILHDVLRQLQSGENWAHILLVSHHEENSLPFLTHEMTLQNGCIV